MTIKEHEAPVTGIVFCADRKAFVSCSLDGTVRLFNQLNFRSFRTCTTPRPVQFNCVSIDPKGDYVVAGGKDVFSVYMWTVSTGLLVNVSIK
jgi:periodic tryptophan protein 2